MRVSLLAVVCAGLALVAASGAGAQQRRYLFDILKQPAYRAAWTKMIGRPGSPLSWLKADRLAGPGGPSTVVAIDGTGYERADTCKIHDCGDNQFFALFTPNAARAVGALVQPGRTRFFGAPTPGEKRALLGR